MLAAARAAVVCTRAESTDARPSGRSPLAGISGRLTGPGRVAGWSLAILNRSGAPPHIVTCFVTPINRGGLAGVDGGWMGGRWYQEAVIYCVEVESFQDSDGDGCGDLRGLISRLDYLVAAGRDLPVAQPDPPSTAARQRLRRRRLLRRRPAARHTRRLRRADPPGARARHPHPARPGRQPHLRRAPLVPRRAAQRPDSPYRDWYVWSDAEPPDRRQGIVFPGEQTETWTFDERAGAWYFHRFYDFQPDLNWSNPAVRAEIGKVMGFWLAARRVRLPDRRGAVRPGAGGARRGPGAAGLLDPGRLAAGHPVARRGLGAAVRGERRARAMSRSTPAAARTARTTGRR